MQTFYLNIKLATKLSIREHKKKKKTTAKATMVVFLLLHTLSALYLDKLVQSFYKLSSMCLCV